MQEREDPVHVVTACTGASGNPKCGNPQPAESGAMASRTAAGPQPFGSTCDFSYLRLRRKHAVSAEPRQCLLLRSISRIFDFVLNIPASTMLK